MEMEREELKQDLSEMLAVIAEEQERNRSLEVSLPRYSIDTVMWSIQSMV